MYRKLYNPTYADLTVKAEDTFLVVPSKGYVVVSEKIGEEIHERVSTLEVTPVTQEDYLAYRKEKDDLEKLAKAEAEKKAKAALEAKKAEEKLLGTKEKVVKKTSKKSKK